jgi:VWFA-related protein
MRSATSRTAAGILVAVAALAGTADLPTAQQPAPAAAATQPPAPDAQPPIFRSGVKLVLVDVSVTGGDDQPVADLGPGDFELTEDGVPQKVEQATLVRLDGNPRGDTESLEIRSQDHALAEAGRDDVRVFAVFMDDYHLGRYPQEMLPLRKALADFLGPMLGPRDLVTVMNPITPLSALQWTRDKDKLLRELKTYEGRIDNFIGRSPLEESQNLTRNVQRVRSQVVVSALHALIMHLAGLREGRKTLLVVSRGIPLHFDVSLEQEFQAMLREANRGNVIIHALDPRGLGQGVFAHDTLYRLTAETGGQAIVNTNDLSAGLRRVVRDASHHYLLGYAPTRELNDGKFHKLEVKVKRRGVKTVARKGYWAPTVEELAPVLETPMEPAVSGALTKLQARQDARVAQVMTSFAPGANGRTALVASWRPVPGFRDRPERLEVEARGADGAALAAGEATLATDGTGAVRLEVPAGEATLRFTAHGASGDIVDRWDEPVKVPDLSGRTFDLASPQFLRALNTAAFQALRKGGGGTPSPDREFRASDLIVVRTAVATGDGPDAKVQAEVLTREGKPLAAWPASTVGGEHQVELPVRSLALGEYVLRFTATRGDETAMSTAGFAIVR